jgi:hypothetical protein
MTTAMDKDRLAAFVDGELTPEEAAQVAMHLADHPADQAYVDDLYAANEALARAFAAPLHQPVPDGIMGAIMGGAAPNVVPFRRRIPLVAGGMALAASLIAVALLLPGLTAGPDGIALGPVAAADPVVQTLNTQPSGVPVALSDGRQSMVLASFAMPDGRFCREFELVDAARGRVDFALGCRSDGPWIIEAVIAEVVVEGQGYVPADGGEANTLTSYLQRSGEPELLDADAELAAIQRSWAAP